MRPEEQIRDLLAQGLFRSAEILCGSFLSAAPPTPEQLVLLSAALCCSLLLSAALCCSLLISFVSLPVPSFALSAFPVAFPYLPS
jgi:hypothetical protein